MITVHTIESVERSSNLKDATVTSLHCDDKMIHQSEQDNLLNNAFNQAAYLTTHLTCRPKSIDKFVYDFAFEQKVETKD